MANISRCTAGTVTTPHAFQTLRHCASSRRVPMRAWRTLEQWLFLDTETTGLAGGTGTYPFLVGLAWWEGGGLEVEQLFMREYSEERSLLAALAERLAERPVLVTFNGKSFDWPLLETRYRMTRTIAPPEPLAHLDFLHPARNSGVCASAPYGCRNSNAMCWDGTAVPMCRPS